MEFTTGISEFNTTYNLNAIDDYNKYLKGQASFEIDKNAFEEALDKAAKSYPVKDKGDPTFSVILLQVWEMPFQTA